MSGRWVRFSDRFWLVAGGLGFLATAVICVLALVWGVWRATQGEWVWIVLIVPTAGWWLWLFLAFVREFVMPELRSGQRSRFL